MNNDDILSIESTFYNEYKTNEAKQTLYSVMDCETDFVDRRGGDACKNNITDMLCKLSTAPLYR